MKTNTSASASDAPASIAVDAKSVRIRIGVKWAKHAVVALLSLASVGGVGYVGFNVVTINPASAAEVKALDASNSSDHKAIRGELRAEADKASVDRAALATVTQTVQRMEDKQIRGQAREEAHRLTDDIRDRRRAAFEYDRLFELNLRRLAAGRDPCGTLACE